MKTQIFNTPSTNPSQGQAVQHGKEQVGEYLLEFKVEHRALSRTASEYNIGSKLTCPDCYEEVHVGMGGPKNLELHCTSKAHIQQKLATKAKQDHLLHSFFSPRLPLNPSKLPMPALVWQVQDLHLTPQTSALEPSVVKNIWPTRQPTVLLNALTNSQHSVWSAMYELWLCPKELDLHLLQGKQPTQVVASLTSIWICFCTAFMVLYLWYFVSCLVVFQNRSMWSQNTKTNMEGGGGRGVQREFLKLEFCCFASSLFLLRHTKPQRI